MFRLIPAPLHRAVLPLAHAIRHRWRKFSKRPIAGCSVFITDFGGALLLLRHSYGPEGWALPGGGIKPSEDPEATAIREVQEELGLTLPSITALGTIEEVLSGAPHTAHLFTAVCNEHPRPDRREILEARFFPMHSLPEPLNSKTRSRLEHWQSQRKQGET
ncbi:MAG: NUDIX domain-containing protein [Erythrobacter sp.]